MALFRKFLKVTIAFLCITFFFLFVPASFMQTKQPSQVVMTSLPGYSDEDEYVLGVSDEIENYIEVEKEGCGCASEEQPLENVEVLGENIETQSSVDGNVEKGGICVLTTEIETNDYHVYRSGEKVIIEIDDETNYQSVRDAYRFVQKQDCVIANSNLEWILE